MVFLNIFKLAVKVNNLKLLDSNETFYASQERNSDNKHEILWLFEVKCELVVDRK